MGFRAVVIADTHALLWWALSPQALSRAAREAMDHGPVCFTVITCMEIASLVRRKRVDLDIPALAWLDDLQALPNVALIPLTLEVAVAAAQLPDSVRDPADRLIVAHALLQGAPLVTRDHKIIASGLVPTIW